MKLLDWGIAKVISTDVRHTIEGQLVGTPQYLSPEQARGAAVSPQTDVYSLGVMAYELFLEQLPFEAETAAEIMAMHLRAVAAAAERDVARHPAAASSTCCSRCSRRIPRRARRCSTVAHTLELIRGELQRRRQTPPTVLRPATAMPAESCAATRIRAAPQSSPGLRPDRRGFRVRRVAGSQRRWHVVVGAFALAASAAMFLISRDTENALLPLRRDAATADGQQR